MIRIAPYRRPSLDGELLFGSVACALVCHKGNAGQTQSNQQTGAQTAGVAVSGSGNVANSGAQINIGVSAANSTGGRRSTRSAGGAGSSGGSGSAKATNVGIGNKSDQVQTTSTVYNNTVSTGVSSGDITEAIKTFASAITPKPVAPVDPNVTTETANADGSATQVKPVKKITWQAIAAISGGVILLGVLAWRFFKKK